MDLGRDPGVCKSLGIASNSHQCPDPVAKLLVLVPLCRAVMQSEGIGVGGALWVQVLDDLLVPLVSDFARTVSFQVRLDVLA